MLSQIIKEDKGMVLSKRMAEGFRDDGLLVAEMLEDRYYPSGRILYHVNKIGRNGEKHKVADHLRKETAEMLVEDIVEYQNYLIN